MTSSYTVRHYTLIEGCWVIAMMLHHRPVVTMKDMNFLSIYIQTLHPEIGVVLNKDQYIWLVEHFSRHYSMNDNVLRRIQKQDEDDFKTFCGWHIPKHIRPTILEFIQTMDRPDYATFMSKLYEAQPSTRKEIVDKWKAQT